MTITDDASGTSYSLIVEGASGSVDVEVTGSALACTYAPDYYECDGETCLNDADGDGVCDELEIAGCVVPTACNYVASGVTGPRSLCLPRPRIQL